MTSISPKERPILFSAPMVQAILAGTKTQTRRIVKPQPKHMPILAAAGLTVGCDPARDGAEWLDADCINPGIPMRCPYGQPGDRLWVRETWGTNSRWDDIKPSELPSGDIRPALHYAADFEPNVHPERLDRWRPSIFLPRWASRITLEVVSVRVERLQEISEADARAEGTTPVHCEPESIMLGTYKARYRFRDGYKLLWEKINGPGSWAVNPWVWIVEFNRVQP